MCVCVCVCYICLQTAVDMSGGEKFKWKAQITVGGVDVLKYMYL